MQKLPKLIEVRPLERYQLWVKYSNGNAGVVDLSELAGQGVFALWNDYREFQKVFLGPYGELAWNEQVEIRPDSVYLRNTGKKSPNQDIVPLAQASPLVSA
ncbi:MAG: DUF2442 domain-containing protein [candidate division KSB1 bacterium]